MISVYIYYIYCRLCDYNVELLFYLRFKLFINLSD